MTACEGECSSTWPWLGAVSACFLFKWYAMLQWYIVIQYSMLSRQSPVGSSFIFSKLCLQLSGHNTGRQSRTCAMEEGGIWCKTVLHQHTFCTLGWLLPPLSFWSHYLRLIYFSSQFGTCVTGCMKKDGYSKKNNTILTATIWKEIFLSGERYEKEPSWGTQL